MEAGRRGTNPIGARWSAVEEPTMKKRATAILLAALLALLGAACDDTIEGAEQDVEEGVEQIEEETDQA